MDGSVGERIDLDRWKAERFTWRLFLAHPALGLARRCGVSVSDLDGVACGALTDDAVDALVATVPQLVVVEAAELALNIDGDPLCMGVWTDRWKAPALERQLLDHVWDEARRREGPGMTVVKSRRREVDRALRANLVVVWDRHGGKITLAAFGLAALVGWHPLGDSDWADAAVLLVGGLATALGIDWLVNRWYHRSQREP